MEGRHSSVLYQFCAAADGQAVAEVDATAMREEKAKHSLPHPTEEEHGRGMHQRPVRTHETKTVSTLTRRASPDIAVSPKRGKTRRSNTSSRLHISETSVDIYQHHRRQRHLKPAAPALIRSRSQLTHTTVISARPAWSKNAATSSRSSSDMSQPWNILESIIYEFIKRII